MKHVIIEWQDDDTFVIIHPFYPTRAVAMRVFIRSGSRLNQQVMSLDRALNHKEYKPS